MSSNLIVYANPLFWAIKTCLSSLPTNYLSLNRSTDSSHSALIKQIATRVLNAEIQSKGSYKERILEMIQELPDSVGSKNISTWIAYRLKVVTLTRVGHPIYSTGTDVDIGRLKGQFFIAIDPKIEKTMEEALPWFTAHEICTILEEDWLNILIAKTIVSLSTTVLSRGVLGWGIIPSVCAPIVANMITHVILSRSAEKRADDFANKHCSSEERKKAIACFEKWQRSEVQGRIAAYTRSLSHLSNDSRIKNIKRVELKESQTRTQS